MFILGLKLPVLAHFKFFIKKKLNRQILFHLKIKTIKVILLNAFILLFIPYFKR